MHSVLSNPGTVGAGDVLAWILVVFFLAGGAMNIRPGKTIRQSYARWGYPNWFHYVTAVLELSGALLLLLGATRTFGALLLATVMAAAVGTLFKHHEAARSVPAGVALILCLACAWLSV